MLARGTTIFIGRKLERSACQIPGWDLVHILAFLASLAQVVQGYALYIMSDKGEKSDEET